MLFKRVNVCRYASALSLGDERWIWLRPCVVLASVVALRYEFRRQKYHHVLRYSMVGLAAHLFTTLFLCNQKEPTKTPLTTASKWSVHVTNLTPPGSE